MPKIWCLFSVDCNYDQPDHNLTAWWAEKPSLEKLANFLGHTLGEDDETTVKIVNIWAGKRTSLTSYGPDYRLEEIEEGGVV